ncbi:MAG TPA: bifunctional hydroxymethylpyrimidine kinase/phosphomethylpyrimidine kinase [Acidimicrobiales bacterium]|nr:bifunctional hydroxymethylpyrimidine kinase/phosphomethylpyrimidine kinase [Acidimicrobiales bacterium]
MAPAKRSALRADEPPPVALTIAGTDSGGGAGVAVDLKTFAALGVFGTLVVTAVTAQNTKSVRAVEVLAPELVDAQLDAVLDDFAVAAVKTGMLASLAIVERVAARAAAGALPCLVVDPVMVATSGSSLLAGDDPAAYRLLLPHATVVTPNLAEAEVLVGRPLAGEAAMGEAARELCARGATAALVKGGHRPGAEAVDVLCFAGELTWLRAPWVATGNVHGTGCTLSAALAAHLAGGAGIVEAAFAAKRFVTDSLRRSATGGLGHGAGPLHRLGPGKA